MLSRSGLGLLLILWYLSARAGEVELVAVENKGDDYHLTVQSKINVSPQYLFAAITDYQHLNRAWPAIMESEVLGRGDSDVVWLRTVTRLCVAIFCANLNQVQKMTSDGTGRLSAKVVSEGSDFHSGQASWQVSGEQHTSTMVFSAVVDPKFWMPPLIGSWLLKIMLRNEAESTIQALEGGYQTRSG